MATKAKTTDLLNAWDETVVTVHMNVGKVRKMDEAYRENRDILKQKEDLEKQIAEQKKEHSAEVDYFHKQFDAFKLAHTVHPQEESQENNDQKKANTELLTFFCEGILDALGAENGIVIKNPATALSLFMEAREWLLNSGNADVKPSII